MAYFWIFSVIAILSVTILDLLGATQFSALSLVPLFGAGWALKRYSKKEIGLFKGKAKDYALAIGYPFVVLAIILSGLWLTGNLHYDVKSGPWKVLAALTINATVSVILVFLTEEGFFRGFLWRILEERGFSPDNTLFATTVVFAVWHIPVALIEFGDTATIATTLIFMANVVLLSLNWGLLRQRSNSVVVAAVSHSVWNTLVYFLFGFGEEITGALDLSTTSFFSPERGLLGVILNLTIFAIYFRKSYIPEQT